MNDFKENVKKDPVPIYTCKKRPGPNLTNSRNYAYSTCCNHSTKLLLRRNGTNVKETANIENNLNLVYNIFM